MQLLGRLEIKSREKIIEFLNQESTGRIGTVDETGHPLITPMNFVFIDDAVYMHSHTKGEKIDNIIHNNKVGFEVDRNLEFLPSYFEHETDASLADTLYISVIIKGKGSIVSDPIEKTFALNGLMKKYQPEGRYEPVRPEMRVLDEVAVIKVIPETIRGKYKIGQNLPKNKRTKLANQIFSRNSKTAYETLKIMGFAILDNRLKMIDEPSW